MIEKEFRALLPVWAVCAAGLLASAMSLPLPIRSAGAAVYVLSCAALGALAFGHEYSHGTMALLLTQPIARRRIYLVKLGVLAVLLFALRAFLFVVPFPEGQSPFGPLLVSLPLLAALFLAPWLTLVTRMPLAGAMFSLSLASLVLMTANWLVFGGFGYTDEVAPLKITIIRWGMLALCSVGAVMGWRTFSRLEIVEGGRMPLLASRRRQAAEASTRRAVRRAPAWLLVKKELRLHVLTALAPALFVAGYRLPLSRPDRLIDRVDALGIMCAINLIVVSLLAGSLASAEERHLGTLDWQLLLPPSAAKQWTIKVATVLGLALLLAVVLPAALVWLLPPDAVVLHRRLLPNPEISALVVLVCVSASLYVSSLVPTGVRAFLTSTVVLLASGIFMRLVYPPLWATIPAAWRLRPRTILGAGDIVAIAVVALALALIRLAFSNHRTADRGTTRVATQAACIAAGLVAIVAVSIVAGL